MPITSTRRSPRVRRLPRASQALRARVVAQIRGFSLVEVMVALIVLSVGLLGIARMQSLAVSSTKVASQRSLAAIEAASLAAMMHENRGYWAGGDPQTSTITVATTLTNSTVTVDKGAPNLITALAAGTDCRVTAAPACTPASLAAFDLVTWWGPDLVKVLPGSTATVNCGTTNPTSCMITITWLENAVAVNSQQAKVATAGAGTADNSLNPTYSLYVQP